MILTGKNIIGEDLSAAGQVTLRAYDPVSNAFLPENFHIATPEEVDRAMLKAVAAFRIYRNTTPEQRAVFLETIAAGLAGLGDELPNRASLESGLPAARTSGETMRTINQLKLFAAVLREGSWVQAVIDTAIPNRQPLPRPDIRKMLVPLGPVLVFPASNFPLAFSTAGGDTAAALAAGNPVIVKAHESHPGTNELVAMVIRQAAQECGMPDGVFSSLTGTGPLLGQQLVKHPAVKAIAFTGSFRAGKAIMDAAAQREEPVPVYAEMGSINPVLLLPGKLQQQAKTVAGQLAASVLQGAGQFCTSPGLLIALDNEDTHTFLQEMAAQLSAATAAPMLNTGICRHYYEGRSRLAQLPGVESCFIGTDGRAETTATPALFQVPAARFITDKALQQEVFGPAALAVICKDEKEMLAVVQQLQGQLTGTVMAAYEELPVFANVIQTLSDKSGRLIFNGVPTGVEVSHAMVHGGPYPATGDGRSTSVGADAIVRFTRPCCYQDCPPALLPPALQDHNPLGIFRKVNGTWQH